MNIFIETIDIMNILLSIVLVSFVFVLVGLHIFTGAKDKKKAKIKEKILQLIDDNDKSVSDICRIKNIKSVDGLRVLDELTKEFSDVQLSVLRVAVADNAYEEYLKKSISSKRYSVAVLTTKLAGEFRLSRFVPEILNNLKKWENHEEAQQLGLLALFLNGSHRELCDLLSNKSFELIVSFRTIQELVESYTGDKESFFKEILSLDCDTYIKRACIQTIGSEGITSLSEQVMDFFESENLNILISTARALGALKYSPAKEKLIKKLANCEWELACAIIDALAKIDPDNCYETILPFVFHKEWWVRYRTAETLVSVSDSERLVADIEKSGDKYAQEIVSYMLERKKLMKEGA